MCAMPVPTLQLPPLLRADAWRVKCDGGLRAPPKPPRRSARPGGPGTHLGCARLWAAPQPGRLSAPRGTRDGLRLRGLAGGTRSAFYPR